MEQAKYFVVRRFDDFKDAVVYDVVEGPQIVNGRIDYRVAIGGRGSYDDATRIAVAMNAYYHPESQS